MYRAEELQSIIDKELPLAAAGGFRVHSLSPEFVCIKGELKKNRNHHGTVFGGSQSVALILCGWAMVREMMQDCDPEAYIVIASQTMDYLRPVSGDFKACCKASDPTDALVFFESYRTRGKAKIRLTAELFEDSSDEDLGAAARMSCLFVAVRPAETTA